MPEAELFAAWCAGDATAGMTLFERHYDSVARFFRNKVDDSAREDLIQQTFLACVEAHVRCQPVANFRGYLFGIAYRVLSNYVRETTRRRTKETGAIDLDQCSSDDLGQSPEAMIVFHQEQRLLLRALRRISMKHQVALELHYWERLTAGEVAEVMGIPLGTAKTRLRDGRRRLEKEIRRLAASKTLMKSTIDNLDRWAQRIRGGIARHGGSLSSRDGRQSNQLR